MGTNYYVREKECKQCGRHEEIHLGKNSYGWEFSFQYNGGQFYKNINEMQVWLKEKRIYDEYGDKVSYKDFWDMVKSKIGGLKHFQECPGDKSSFSIDGYSFTDSVFS